MRSSLALIIALGSMLCLPASASATEIYLLADFDDKAIDQPIGTGGAEVGEPVQVYTEAVEATVRATPMSTPCLQITDVDDYYGGAAWFGFLGGAEISSGQVVIRLQIWLPEMDGQSCSIGVREHDSAAHTFIDLDFASDGSVFCYDENGSAGIDGTCPLNQAVPIRIAFDMTAGTYDVTLNGTPLVVGRAHGVTGAGIGSVLVGCNNDGNVGDHFYVDDLYVADGDPTPAEPASWGAVKTQFLGPE